LNYSTTDEHHPTSVDDVMVERSRLAFRLHDTFVRGDRLAMLLVVLWPFAFLWPYTLRQISVGNDFVYLYWQYKAHLLAAVSSGHFPLWSPTESAGYPFFSNPYAQPFYPLNVIYLLFYALLGNFSTWHYTLFTIMALSIFGAGLLLWLRLLGFSRSIACTAVVIALMSLKLTETLRFPNAAHSAAWMPWLLFGVTLAAHGRHLLTGSLIFAAATLLVLTAGYPYYVIYTAFLVGPYVLAMLIPASRSAFLGIPKEQQTGSFRLLLAIVAAFAVPAAIASPWLIHVGALLSQTVDRATPIFAFATAHRFTLQSTIGSWIFPPAAPMEGWYYFGMTATLLIGSYLCCVVAGRGMASRHRAIALMIVFWAMFVIYFTWGSDSVLFTAAWRYLPVVNQMRVWARLNIVLVPALACLLALSLQYVVSLLESPDQKPPPGARTFFIALIVLSVAGLGAQAYMAENHVFDYYWLNAFKAPTINWGELKGFARFLSHRLDPLFFCVMTVVAAACLLGFPIAAQRRPLSIRTRPFLVAVLAVSVVDLFYVANFQWPYPFYRLSISKGRVGDLVSQGMGRPRSLVGNSVDVVSHAHNVGILDNWNFARHAAFFARFFDTAGVPRPAASPTEIAAAKRLFGADERAQRIFFSSQIDFTSPIDFIADTDAMAAQQDQAMAVAFYDGDVLRLNVRTDRPAWLSVIDNWDPNWRASVDGQAVPIALLFGSYKAVHIDTPGEHVVTFSYRPSLLP